MDKPSTLGELIDAASKRHNGASGRRLAELAQEAGYSLSHATINRLRRGDVGKINQATIEALAHLAAVPLEVVMATAAGDTGPSPESLARDYSRIQADLLRVAFDYARARGIKINEARDELEEVLVMSHQLKDGRPWTPPWNPGEDFEAEDTPWKESWWHTPAAAEYQRRRDLALRDRYLATMAAKDEAQGAPRKAHEEQKTPFTQTGRRISGVGESTGEQDGESYEDQTSVTVLTNSEDGREVIALVQSLATTAGTASDILARIAREDQPELPESLAPLIAAYSEMILSAESIWRRIQIEVDPNSAPEIVAAVQASGSIISRAGGIAAMAISLAARATRRTDPSRADLALIKDLEALVLSAEAAVHALDAHTPMLQRLKTTALRDETDASLHELLDSRSRQSGYALAARDVGGLSERERFDAAQDVAAEAPDPDGPEDGA
ncbi:hypothetical protein [Gordonia caeni]|uniref:Helix-turn-helix transcriptional regulator n=1 Tax=Gordonia caeni TaxID=1007097 RepID=A0ABP7PBB1_9ACTN